MNPRQVNYGFKQTNDENLFCTLISLYSVYITEEKGEEKYIWEDQARRNKKVWKMFERDNKRARERESETWETRMARPQIASFTGRMYKHMVEFLGMSDHLMNGLFVCQPLKRYREQRMRILEGEFKHQRSRSTGGSKT